MRVNILSYEPAGGWILYDYAVRLAEALRPHVAEAVVDFRQLPGFHVTFHVNYAGLRQLEVPGLHATMVTHIDTAEKFALVRAQAAAGVWGYCMSDDTARRMNTLTGLPQFENFAPPAMTAGEPRRLKVLIAGRLYEDGRKNESWVTDFVHCFRPGDLALKVMGAGWEGRLAALTALGHAVEHVPNFDRGLYTQWLHSADHLLVTGHDEGALSTLDALLCGVVPIVTAQGYHLEQEGEIITFATHAQLMAVGHRLQAALDVRNAERQRLTDWDAFARRHAAHWRSQIEQLLSAQRQSAVEPAPAPETQAVA